jgi:hypothetical protein
MRSTRPLLRSLTRALPSGRKASPHGTVSPLAATCGAAQLKLPLARVVIGSSAAALAATATPAPPAVATSAARAMTIRVRTAIS